MLDGAGLLTYSSLLIAGSGGASWRSGYAEDCKSLHPGSIPGEASTHFQGVDFAPQFANSRQALAFPASALAFTILAPAAAASRRRFAAST